MGSVHDTHVSHAVGNYENLVPYLECSQFSNLVLISDLTHQPTRNKTNASCVRVKLSQRLKILYG